jgi:Tol biopolymer transport system component
MKNKIRSSAFLLLLIAGEGARANNFPHGEFQPAFSPDGDRIAFVWDGVKGNNYDIYVNRTGSRSPLRLTTDPARDFSPAWSPDGRHIAFYRESAEGSNIYMTPHSGGAERWLGRSAATAARLAWSADGNSIAIVDRTSPQEPFSIFLLSIDSGEKRRLTTPPKRAISDDLPVFSPDGRTLAFCRNHEATGADIYLLPVTGGGGLRRLNINEGTVRGLDWTLDGRSLIFSSSQGLWRISESGPPERLPEDGSNVHSVSLSRKGRRLAYAQYGLNISIWRTAGPASVDPATARGLSPPVKLISSDGRNGSPNVSRDGKKIVFSSTRSGAWEQWVCDSDGGNVVQLTFFGDTATGSARWSPDGRYIVFDGLKGGHYDMYLIEAEGGRPRRLTTEPSNEVKPSWSKDGRWIYFASNRTGSYQVWKMPVEGGEPVQVTKGGGYTVFESLDGRTLYYSKGRRDSRLWMVPVAGGDETQILDGVGIGRWIVTDQGICILNMEATPRPVVEFFRFADRRRVSLDILPTEGIIYGGGTALATPPDGRWVLFGQAKTKSKIVLVENFR